MKNLGLIFLAVLLSISSFSQDMSSVFQTQSATWYGLDFSEAYFIGSEGFVYPKEVKDKYFNSWNMLIKNEYDKYDIGKCFQKENVEFSLDNVAARNSEVSIYDRVIDDVEKTMHLDNGMVQEIVGSYDLNNDTKGLGIVLIVESFNKRSEMGNYFVTFFDTESKRVLLTKRMSGKAKGFGFRNYWANSYHDVMNDVKKKQYENWEKKYKSSTNIEPSVSINSNTENKNTEINDVGSNSDIFTNNNNINKISVVTSSSDVDQNIPINDNQNEYKFALIIGNEDYSTYQSNLTSEVNVSFAVNDAEVFSLYCEKVLGVPNENIILLKNVIGTQLKREVNKISKMMKYTKGKAEIIFYYAGHGIPHEETKESYIMPVDVSSQNIEDGVKLSWVYQKLTEYSAKYVIAFIDACFTGGARNQGLIAARGVKIKPKENLILGKCVVFTSSSDIQSSLPYYDKQHGMFTYYLLKKIQESRGDITLGELSDYLYENVALNSLRINNKEQTPETIVSSEFEENWRQIKINE